MAVHIRVVDTDQYPHDPRDIECDRERMYGKSLSDAHHHESDAEKDGEEKVLDMEPREITDQHAAQNRLSPSEFLVSLDHRDREDDDRDDQPAQQVGIDLRRRQKTRRHEEQPTDGDHPG